MNAAPPAGDDRALLRRRLIEARQGLPDRDARETALAEHVRRLLERSRARRVAAYWPIRGEPQLLAALMQWCEAAGQRTLALPVIEGDRLRFAPWRRGDPMTPDAYGIPSPATAARIAPDWLLLPCVGVSAGGHRLGYGGGYYDRTLPQLDPRPRTVGVLFACGEAAPFTAQAHDARVDWVVTEHGVRAVEPDVP